MPTDICCSFLRPRGLSFFQVNSVDSQIQVQGKGMSNLMRFTDDGERRVQVKFFRHGVYKDKLNPTKKTVREKSRVCTSPYRALYSRNHVLWLVVGYEGYLPITEEVSLYCLLTIAWEPNTD